MSYKKFSDFADEPELLDGEKLNIKNIINKEILITGYRISDSQYNDSKCLTLQFEYEDEKHIIFTGSQILIGQIEKYNKEMPFFTIIKKIDKYYTFT